MVRDVSRAVRKTLRVASRAKVTWDGPAATKWVRSVAGMGRNISRASRAVTRNATRAAQRDFQRIAQAVKNMTRTQKAYDRKKMQIAMRVFTKYFASWYKTWGCTSTSSRCQNPGWFFSHIDRAPKYCGCANFPLHVSNSASAKGDMSCYKSGAKAACF